MGVSRLIYSKRFTYAYIKLVTRVGFVTVSAVAKHCKYDLTSVNLINSVYCGIYKCFCSNVYRAEGDSSISYSHAEYKGCPNC